LSRSPQGFGVNTYIFYLQKTYKKSPIFQSKDR